MWALWGGAGAPACRVEAEAACAWAPLGERFPDEAPLEAVAGMGDVRHPLHNPY